MAHPLPPHKFSPHDVVDVRPNKSDSSGPALVGGLVYRVKEDCITVAVEEAPDEGLDQPLRLEKLANEVRICDLLAAEMASVSCAGAFVPDCKGSSAAEGQLASSAFCFVLGSCMTQAGLLWVCLLLTA